MANCSSCYDVRTREAKWRSHANTTIEPSLTRKLQCFELRRGRVLSRAIYLTITIGLFNQDLNQYRAEVTVMKTITLDTYDRFTGSLAFISRGTQICANQQIITAALRLGRPTLARAPAATVHTRRSQDQVCSSILSSGCQLPNFDNVNANMASLTVHSACKRRG